MLKRILREYIRISSLDSTSADGVLCSSQSIELVAQLQYGTAGRDVHQDYRTREGGFIAAERPEEDRRVVLDWQLRLQLLATCESG